MIDLGLGEYTIIDNMDQSIRITALGSCIGFVMHCPKTKYTAMAHIVLAKKTLDHNEHNNDGYFASEIVPKILDFFIKQPDCDINNVKIVLVGGSESLKENDYFKIGPRNLEEISMILNEYGLKYNKTETLGHFSRTIQILNGHLTIKKQSMFI